MRKDWENLAPFIVDKAKQGGWTIDISKNVADILEDHDVHVSKGAIDTVIWSHHHWDHTGDMTTFPRSTSLVIGPGFSKQYLPGYPERKDAPVLASDFEGRDVREINIEKEGKGFKISRFNAYDYFGDGSFYLLDTPGHSVGHMCGLARTTSSGPASGSDRATFVFMGGDACHHGGEFRPSAYLPLPKEIDPSPLKKIQPVCPGHLLQEIHRTKSATEPFYLVAPGFAHDSEVAEWTIGGLQEFDAHDNVLLLTAHDASVLDALEFYPKSLNGWAETGLGKEIRWKFLGDFEEAVMV